MVKIQKFQAQCKKCATEISSIDFSVLVTLVSSVLFVSKFFVNSCQYNKFPTRTESFVWNLSLCWFFVYLLNKSIHTSIAAALNYPCKENIYFFWGWFKLHCKTVCHSVSLSLLREWSSEWCLSWLKLCSIDFIFVWLCRKLTENFNVSSYWYAYFVTYQPIKTTRTTQPKV